MLGDGRQPQIFLANAKDDEAPNIEKWLGELRELFPGTEVHAARDDYMTNFGRCGGWKEWTGSVVQRYDAFVVPNRMFVGQATADIVRNAIFQHKQVAVLSAGSLIEIKNVEGGHGRMKGGGWKLCVTATSRTAPVDGAQGSGRTPFVADVVDVGQSAAASQVPEPRQEAPHTEACNAAFATYQAAMAEAGDRIPESTDARNCSCEAPTLGAEDDIWES